MVPKIHDPNTINDYRPISLIGCLYKTSKDSRRKVKVVHLVVSPSQTTFIKNRNILDDPLAFDSLSWEYLDSILQQMNFGGKWRSWIHDCFSSTRISVLINGIATS
uniref:Uncharacterized protein n=1 Tax=Lactuca sativa TaxID=4236 RepID=A0A9R1WRS6_LACSA|nr:hypothetical protein LSAT_V11C100023880 [Lactuca sativa]